MSNRRPYFFEAGLPQSGQFLRLQDYETVGRSRILPGNEISPRIGYDITFLDNTPPTAASQSTDRCVGSRLEPALPSIRDGS